MILATHCETGFKGIRESLGYTHVIYASGGPGGCGYAECTSFRRWGLKAPPFIESSRG